PEPSGIFSHPRVWCALTPVGRLPAKSWTLPGQADGRGGGADGDGRRGFQLEFVQGSPRISRYQVQQVLQARLDTLQAGLGVRAQDIVEQLRVIGCGLAARDAGGALQSPSRARQGQAILEHELTDVQDALNIGFAIDARTARGSGEAEVRELAL